MAKTPYEKVGSQDILSAHITGLSFSINNIETALNMKTRTSTISLSPVIDQDDLSLRYRIYEGDYRGWTQYTIKRNGNIVNSSEYVCQPGYGVVVFNIQQSTSDKITAEITFIDSESTRISGIETNQTSLSSEVTNVKKSVTSIEGEVSTLKTDVDELKENGGGSSPSTSASGYGQVFPIKTKKALWLNILPDFTSSDLTASVNVGMAAQSIDAIPIFIETRTKITQLEVDVYNINGTTMVLGIYSNVNAQPDKLLASTKSFTPTGNSNKIDLTEPVVLDVGLYWVARYQSAAVGLNGYKNDKNVMITIETPSSTSIIDASGATDIIGVRWKSLGNITSLPDTFIPLNSTTPKYLARADVGAVKAYS